MSDKIENKIENKQQVEKNQESTLSNAAFDLLKGAAAGAMVGAGAAAAMNKEHIQRAVVGGVAGVGGVIAQEVVKENQKELQHAGKVIQQGVQAAIKEALDTPKDLGDHIRKRPVTAAVEAAAGGIGAAVMDAKLRKWLGW